MAKDDYHVIVARILVYLYQRLRGKTEKPIEYLSPYSKDFPITEDYFQYVVENLQERGYIKGVHIMYAWGGEIVQFRITERVQITPEGIDYLRENSGIKKALSAIPTAQAIASLFHG